MALASLRVDVYLTPGDRVAALRKDVLLGLTSDPKELPAKWFYNDRGSALFEEITRLPEYYLTSRERSILLADGRVLLAHDSNGSWAAPAEIYDPVTGTFSATGAQTLMWSEMGSRSL